MDCPFQYDAGYATGFPYWLERHARLASHLSEALVLIPWHPVVHAYLLWLLMGFTLVVAVLVVTAGRLGDIFGRTRMYNLGFAIFTVGSILCSPLSGVPGPLGQLS